MTPLVVTGGTGRLGVALVDRLVAAGRPMRVVSRHPSGRGPGSRT
jgi:nucleoside-diphosphate-sugar epimerase